VPRDLEPYRQHCENHKIEQSAGTILAGLGQARIIPKGPSMCRESPERCPSFVGLTTPCRQLAAKGWFNCERRKTSKTDERSQYIIVIAIGRLVEQETNGKTAANVSEPR